MSCTYANVAPSHAKDAVLYAKHAVLYAKHAVLYVKGAVLYVKDAVLYANARYEYGLSHGTDYAYAGHSRMLLSRTRHTGDG